MPARSIGYFAVASEWFVWPPRPPVVTQPRRTTARPRKAKPVRAPTPRQRSPGSLPTDVREILHDRIFAAIDRGEIDPLDDGEDLSEQVAPTWGELNRLLRILLREDYEPLAPPSRPTNYPPGSAGKVAELERRAAAGEDLYHRYDADPLDDDRLATEPGFDAEIGDYRIDDAPENRPGEFGGRSGRPREPKVFRELRGE